MFQLNLLRLTKGQKIPYYTLLLIVGVLIANLFQPQTIELTGWFKPHFSALLIKILLPILIFEASIQMNFYQLRRDLVPLCVLSIFGLIISTWVVGELLSWLMAIPRWSAFVFGALISATDPISIIALFKSIKAPFRLTHLIEGESLINDGTGIVLFRILFLLSVSQSSDFKDSWTYLQTGLVQFFFISIGGVLCGYGVGLLLTRLLNSFKKSAAAQLALTIIGTYFTFFTAEHVLEVSGVLALMGLAYPLTKIKLFSSFKKQGLMPIWEYLAIAANSIAFLTVGLFTDFKLFTNHWTSSLFIILVVFIARAISVLGTIPILNLTAHFSFWQVGKKLSFEKISMTYQIILILGGIRGGLALALALSLPETFVWKETFLVWTLALIVSSNLINALATSWILKLHSAWPSFGKFTSDKTSFKSGMQ